MALGVAVLVGGVLARRFRVAPPVLLLACGALLGLAPALRRVHLPPEVVLLLFLPALLDRRPQQRLRRVGARARVVSGVAGFRGAVSLASALAVPETVASGTPFPGRNMIIFVTSGSSW